VSENLGDRIAARLLGEIVAGAFPPGSALPPEWELAEREGASRLTIREALRTLRQKSVVQVVRGRGTYVQPPEHWSPLDPVVLSSLSRNSDALAGRMNALLEARMLVEVGVAELAAARRADDDLAAMVSSIQAMREAGADVPAFVAGDLAFHEAVMSAAGNRVVAALYEPIASLLHETRQQTSRDQVAREHAIAAHERILEAITRRSPAQAAWAMRDHLAQTGEDYARVPAARARRAPRQTRKGA
jgi:DNA-binding FadR family transcriptional regulator